MKKGKKKIRGSRIMRDGGILGKLGEAAGKAAEAAKTGIGKSVAAGSKDDVIAGEVQRIMGERGWSMTGSGGYGDTHQYKFAPPSGATGIKEVQISVSRRQATVGLYGIPLGTVGPNTVYIAIGVKLGSFLFVFPKWRQYSFSLNADQYVSDDMVMSSGLTQQLEAWLKSAGL